MNSTNGTTWQTRGNVSGANQYVAFVGFIQRLFGVSEMKYLIWSVIIIVVCGVTNVYAANTSANHGHHGGGNSGALGAAAGARNSGPSNGFSGIGNGGAGNGSGDAGDCDMAHYVLCSKGN